MLSSFYSECVNEWFSAKIYKYRQIRAPKWSFFGGMGVNVKFCFCDPEKARSCAEPLLLTYFASTSVVGSWLWVGFRIPPSKKIAD